MKVGFTGTRDGCTAAQKYALWHWFNGHAEANELHQGCCIGADAYAVQAFHEVKVGQPREVIGHPCDWPAMQSKEACAASCRMLPCRKPLDRNRNIVDATDILLACPKGPEEQRSGTWSTVRYARKKGKRVVVFWPNGEVTDSDDSSGSTAPA